LTTAGEFLKMFFVQALQKFFNLPVEVSQTKEPMVVEFG